MGKSEPIESNNGACFDRIRLPTRPRRARTRPLQQTRANVTLGYRCKNSAGGSLNSGECRTQRGARGAGGTRTRSAPAVGTLTLTRRSRSRAAPHRHALHRGKSGQRAGCCFLAIIFM
ncbi:hypothetical protein EVAR_42617_1 [Eumeta japonica]|uniref:Uncharacterized protein n=1 Tax=Eumeta variegata TaxID=151549 RepID=A0A4C1WVS8_EUMVA|nr:hypothetical protein EVAR_42617_1 [Eumeta japonica]